MIRKNPFLILVFSFLFSLNFYSQNYHTKIEKQFFESYQKDTVNFNLLKGLCVIDTTFTQKQFLQYQSKLLSFIQTLPEKEKSERKEKKRIKKIYNQVHKKFLRKYEIESYFTDIFKKGYYNCVSATALYVYIFDELNIPYHIKEVPAHVYLEAYPKTYKIHIETTVPGAYGLLMPKDSEIKKMVNQLLEVKLVSQSELNNKGYKKVFYDYYYGEDYKNRRDLIGMQYYNKSLFDYGNEKIEAAFQSILKSTQFYVNPFSEVVLKDLSLNRIAKLNVNSSKEIGTFLKALQQVDYKEDDKYAFRQLLYRITEDDENDLEFIRKLVPSFETIKDQSIRDFCVDYLYTYLASKNTEKHNFKESIFFSEKLLEIDADNKQAKDILIYSIYGSMYNLPFTKDNLLRLEEYFKRYPFLDKDKRTVTLLAIFYAQIAQNGLKERNEEKAFTHLDKFETIYWKDKDLIQINTEIIANLYLLAGRFYYGQNKFKQALEIFEKGLEFYPEHFDLKKMKKWAIEDMK